MISRVCQGFQGITMLTLNAQPPKDTQVFSDLEVLFFNIARKQSFSTEVRTVSSPSAQ